MMGLDMMAKQVELSLGLPVSAPEQSAIDTYDPAATNGCLIYFSIFIGEGDDGIKAEKVLDFDVVNKIHK